MKKAQKALALSLGSLLAVSLFAACNDKKPDEGKKDDPAEGVSYYGRICYDNLNANYLSAADTQVKVSGTVSELSGIDADGKKVAAESIATYDSATGKFTAVSEGFVEFKLDGKDSRLEVTPAYVTDPGNQYTGLTADDTNEGMSKQLGRKHDPSFIEVEEDGKTVYYLFSTGWNDITNYENVRTYGNAIHRSDDGMMTWDYVGRTFNYATRQEDFVDAEAGKWLYDGKCTGFSEADASWWAPDIVPCPSGGYWLYTCVVDGSSNSQGMQIGGGYYARACILLYHADYIYQGEFKYVGVLMQSSILRGESVKDVNGIDPQIIYTPDGKMYMAYGSFGSGNYIIELDPETGLRKDGKGWQTHETIRGYIEHDIQDLYKNTQNAEADGKSVGWVHDYYGTNISKQNMEAPVIARHDGVKIADETAQYDENGEPVGVEGKTYYYSMHSYNGLSDDYQMWGGRSESVLGVYKSAMGKGIVFNQGSNNASNLALNEGNKYMGAFRWSNKSADSKEIDIILPGHNDLFTDKYGTNLAAYITRTPSYASASSTPSLGSVPWVAQVHQYYLNSVGDLVINPNRYAKEIDRSVSKAELLHFTDGGKFDMVSLVNQRDTGSSAKDIKSVSVEVTLKEDGTIENAASAKIGSWLMYGKGYIKISFEQKQANGEQVYYGVVRPAWLYNLDKSGFTITCMGHTDDNRSMGMFMNSHSNMTL